MKHKSRENAPYLVGEIRNTLNFKRNNIELRLPRSVKQGLREIAKDENKSMNWVIEQVLIDYFHLEVPKYKPRKKVNRNGKNL